ncbi:MAG: hypothetical protein NC340_10485 [Ruminococcus flavefaciens]|nr:hypothetical protein [Ruminococcus flavefaciens]MCM1231371.1 hypothetical protein [Ruminococcus flavefaciens]
MTKANTDIRAELKAKNVPVYAVADVMGVHENTLFRRLRHELTEQEKQKLIGIIGEIAQQNTGD